MTHQERIDAALAIQQQAADLLADLKQEQTATGAWDKYRWPINWLGNVVSHMDLIISTMRKEPSDES